MIETRTQLNPVMDCSFAKDQTNQQDGFLRWHSGGTNIQPDPDHRELPDNSQIAAFSIYPTSTPQKCQCRESEKANVRGFGSRLKKPKLT